LGVGNARTSIIVVFFPSDGLERPTAGTIMVIALGVA